MSDNGKNATLSKIGFILVAAGSAVGIGNIWRFPYLVANHGGGTFIFTYMFFGLFIGLSIMLSEFIIGRYLGYPLLDNMKKLKHSKIFSKVIYINLITAFTLISFYFIVTGWTFYYFINSLIGSIEYSSNSTDYYQNVFTNLTTNPITLIIFSMLVTLSTITVNSKGLVEGVEKVNLWFLPLLFLLLIVLIIRVLSLDNASEGLKYIFTFKFSELSSAIIPALGQALFSLSVGMGTMLIFATHTDKSYNLTSSATSTVIVGTTIGIFASMLIIPAVVSFGYDMNSGPGLTFLTLPKVFAHITFGSMFSSIFFLIMAMAAFTSTISIIETSIPYVMKIFKAHRQKAIFIIALYCIISNSIMALSLSSWSNVSVFGTDIFSFVAGPLIDNILIIGVLLVIIIMAFGMKRENIKSELTNEGTINFRLFNFWLYTTIFIAPIIIISSVLYSIFA